MFFKKMISQWENAKHHHLQQIQEDTYSYIFIDDLRHVPLAYTIIIL